MTSKPFYILSIDGGGIRGAYAAKLLLDIERQYRISLGEVFGFITGTSTGSIIAAAVAQNVDLECVVDLYKRHGSLIFTRRYSWLPKFLEVALCSRYQNSGLAKLLKEVLGDITLGEISRPLVIPATDVGNGEAHAFKSAYSKEFVRDGGFMLREAVLASCSAPLYFDPTRCKDYLLADGGLWANNPSLGGVIEAHHRLGIPFESIRVLSVGTGRTHTRYGLRNQRFWGLLTGWKRKTFVDFIMSVQSAATHNYLCLLLEPHQVLRLDFESDGKLPLDDHLAVDDLVGRAARTVVEMAPEIRKFFQTEP